MLVEGAIAPGAKLNERELAEQLQVSRTPLREAIKMLAAEGLVELLPNRGAVAVQLTERATSPTPSRSSPGSKASRANWRRSASRDAELAEIRALHYEMLAAYTRRDLSDLLPHQRARSTTTINAAARNPVLTQTYRTVNARLQALRFRSNFDEAKWKRAVKEHERMIELLGARDGARCARCWSSTWTTSATRCST